MSDDAMADTILADARGDYVTGSSDGADAIVSAAGTGEWRYLAADGANPATASTLDLMTWNATGTRYERVTTGGSINAVTLGITGIASDELGLHPSATFRQPSFVVIRWIAGIGEAGSISIDGAVRLTDSGGTGSISFDMWVDGVSRISTTLTGYNSTALISELATIGVGSTVEFVIGANGSDTFDSTGLQLTISAVPEPSTIVLLAFGCVGLMVLRRRAARA